MKIPIRNLYFLLCYAWDHAEQADEDFAEELDRFEHVGDLFGKLLASRTDRLLRRGIDRGYRERTEEIYGVRGKLELSGTLKRNLMPQGRTECTFEELSVDVLHNRILRSSLDRLLVLPTLNSDVRAEVRRVQRRLDRVTPVDLTPATFRRVQLHSNVRAYRFLLNVCALLRDSLLVGEGVGDTPFLRFPREEITMWRLYEHFVGGFYRREQSTFNVKRSSEIRWFEPVAQVRDDLDRLPRMTADVILESPDRRIVMDTKFYSNAFGGRFGGKLHSKNLYQLLAYLHNRQGAYPQGARYEGILLYPTVRESVRVDVVLHGFTVRARSVDLSGPWRDIRSALLDILEAEPSMHLGSA